MTGAGALRWRVAFDRRVVVSDGYGNERGPFQEQFVVWANVQARFGGEAVTAARLQGQQPVTITVRQSPLTREITPDWRARDARSDQEYAIRSIVDPDGKRQWLEILTQTGVAS
jgi:SPP1 family predicted phage head-tail adaptor